MGGAEGDGERGQLVLTRSGDDRRRHDLEGVGSIRRKSWFGGSSQLRTVAGRVLEAKPVGLLRRNAEAVDEAGGVVGRFTQQGLLRHGGDVVWNGLPHRITSRSSWKNTYEVSLHDSVLFTVQARGWGRTPARVEVHDDRVDAGLVLFTLWLVQQFVDEDSSGAGA